MYKDYISFVTGTHHQYDRYRAEWQLCINSYYGGVEYKNARYLRAYQVDFNTPSESINTYVLTPDGNRVQTIRAKVQYGTSSNETNRGQDFLEGSFYAEKLDNTPLYNYVKLIVSEYNSILFRNPPTRVVPDDDAIYAFMTDVDGEGNSINEFMSLVDTFTTIYGVCHVSCIMPYGSNMPRWRIHAPTEVTNWEYVYDADGNLTLKHVVIQIESNSMHSVYRYFTPETIETIFVGADSNYQPPIQDPDLEQLDQKTYRVVKPNELGYIPVRTIYQSQKVYNNIGTTVIQDVAQIQRSIYGDMAEIYSAITYGAHPTLVVDETTDQLNQGRVGGEPGSIVKVQSSLTGEPSYVYEFRSPQLDAITEIRELVDNKVNKLSQIAMLRTEDLIRAANSGHQIEVFDDKLSAMIRRKATNLENAEMRLWEMWFDWMNQVMPDDFSVSYNRQYNKRALEQELSEVDMLMNMLQKYENMMAISVPGVQPESELPDISGRTYPDGTAIPDSLPELYQLATTSERCGNCGANQSGSCVIWQAPVRTDYTCARWIPTGTADPETEQFKMEMRDRIRLKLTQLLTSSTTETGF